MRRLRLGGLALLIVVIQGCSSPTVTTTPTAAQVPPSPAPIRTEPDTNWLLISTADSFRTYVSKRDWRAEDGAAVYWTLADYRDPQQTDRGTVYQSAIQRELADCENSSWTWLSQTLYSGNNGTGEAFRTVYNDAPVPQRVIPGTVGDTVVTFMCSLSARRS